MLQAAEILLYQADRVPVGEDQRQHLELTRDLAQRFNHRYDPIFVVPEPHILIDAAKILDLQNPDRQMSKSLPGPGCLNLLDDPAASAKKIRSAVTDTGREVRYDPEAKPGVSNLLTILAALGKATVAELEAGYQGRGYGELKEDVAAAFTEFVTPVRRRVADYLDDPAELDAVLARGAQRAREVADSTLRAVYGKIGLLPPSG